MKILLKIFFRILNGIVICSFILPYFAEASITGEPFYSRFWAEPFTYVILVFFLFTFHLKYKAIKKIRKRNLAFKSELGSQFFWFLVKVILTGIWISWIVNGAVFNNNILGGLAFVTSLLSLILIFYWLYYGKKMREEIESRLDETLAKVLIVHASASSIEISKLGSLLKKSELYDKRYDSFSQVLVGLPARSFVARTRTTEYVRRETDSSYSSNLVQTRKEWKFFFCVLIESFGLKKPGLYSKSDFLAFFEKTTAKKYNSALSQFRVSSIEITNAGYVMRIEPNYDIKTLGIKIPSQDNLNQLFMAFAK